MNYQNINNQIKELNYENILWIVFAFLCLLNILGNKEDEEYLKSNINQYKKQSDQTFIFVLIITLFIYCYFFTRNYHAYEKVPAAKKDLYLIKLFGSCFLIAGVLCLIYFQIQQTSFSGSPSL
jgi:uncharacterized membrane protein